MNLEGFALPTSPKLLIVPLGAVFIFAALLSVLLTPVSIWLAKRFGALDDPKRDDRRIHTEVTPRWGGLGVFVAFTATVLAASLLFAREDPRPPFLVGMLLGGLLITIMGMVDDRFGLSARQQTAYMVVVGFGVQFFGGPEGVIRIDDFSLPGLGSVHVWPLLAAVGVAFYIFVVTKTMDTIDGVDGLAAGIAMISSLTLMALAVMGGDTRTAILAAAMGGVCLGFLKWNSAPARIFLAGGAQFVGFTLACISIVGPVRTVGPLAALIPFTVFGVPVIDAIVVVARRIRAGTSITQGDRRHTHHALLAAGLSKRQTVWALYGVSILLSGLILALAAQYR